MNKSLDSSVPEVDMRVVIKELNAIKRLLTLMLLRGGAPQDQVARAAGVAKLVVNKLAK